MRLSHTAVLAALGLAMACSANASPVRYDFQATALTGTLTGPFNGSFTIDLDMVNGTSEYPLADGTIQRSQSEEADSTNVLIDWAVPGDQRLFGTRVSGARVSRYLRPDGSSQLTLHTNNGSSGGGLQSQNFTINFFSNTGVLFNQTEPFLDFGNVTSASGSYDYTYEYSDGDVHKNFTFAINNATAVPEPAALALVLSGLALVGSARTKRRTG